VAQEPVDPLTPPQRSQLAQGESDTTAIKRDIERTRIEMSETIGELQERLRPDHLIQQAKDNVRDAATGKVKNIMHSGSEIAHNAAERARGVGNHLAWYAQAHPIRMAITAGVVTWLVMRNRNTSSNMWYGESDTSWETDRDEYGTDASVRNRVGEYASSARQAVSDYAASAKETASDYAASAKETVNEYAATAASTARSATQRVGSAARSSYSAADSWVHENPLAAGAIAIAVGAAVGLAVRATEYEDRVLGETRDQAMARAREVANNLKANVTEKVATVAENVVGESLKNTSTTTEPPLGRA
jgi:ElaB/YqjD/DUF883 family membrane-anchored ribosome-binding protein